MSHTKQTPILNYSTADLPVGDPAGTVVFNTDENCLNYYNGTEWVTSDDWESTYTTVSAQSGDWDSTYTTVDTNSAAWGTNLGATKWTYSHGGSNPSQDYPAVILDYNSLISDPAGFNAAAMLPIEPSSTATSQLGVRAVDLQLQRDNITQTSGGNISTLLGGAYNKIFNTGTGGDKGNLYQHSAIICGQRNVIGKVSPGTQSINSIIVGGENCNIGTATSLGTSNSVAMGKNCTVKNGNSFIWSDSQGSTLETGQIFETKLTSTFNIHANNGLRLVFDTAPEVGQVLTCQDTDGHSKWATPTTVSLSADEWNSTYTTVSAQSANWSEGASTGVVFDTSQGSTFDHASLKVKDTNTGYSDTDGLPIGDTRGAHAVDLQIYRQNSDEVAAGISSTIVGGQFNKIQGGSGAGSYGAILGGGSNEILGSQYGVILGGQGNKINPDSGNANNSIAAGTNAHAKHPASFIWNHLGVPVFETKLSNTFNIRANNGLRLVFDTTPEVGQVLTCLDTDGHSKWASLSADEWNSTYTTVGSNSAIWDTTTVYTVSTLPSAIGAAGARAFVSDSDATHAAGLGTEVDNTGSGAEFVPVYSNGSIWLIG